MTQLSPPPVRTAMYENGQMTREWTRFFDAVYSRVGGTSDPLSAEIANRVSDDQPNIVVQEHRHYEEPDIGPAIQASLDLAPVKSVFGRLGNVVSAEGDYSLSQLSDVTLSTLAVNESLIFNGTLFANAAIVNSLQGTADQISITSSTGDITLSLPNNMTLGGSTGVINISSNVASTSTSTGALTVAGGVGIAGKMYSTLIQVSSTSASTSRTTGSIITAGGIGANGQITATTLGTNAPTTKTGNYTTVAADSSLIFNGTGIITLTLPTASSFSGRWLYLKNIAAFTVVSASSNVVPITGGAAGTAILLGVPGSWCALQSNGTNWETMMRG